MSAVVAGLLAGSHLALCFPLQKDLESELKENALEQERLQGSPLVYGESIQVSRKFEYRGLHA